MPRFRDGGVVKYLALTVALLQSPPSNLQVFVGRQFCIADNNCYTLVYVPIPWIDPKDIKPEYDEMVIDGVVWGWGHLP